PFGGRTRFQGPPTFHEVCDACGASLRENGEGRMRRKIQAGSDARASALWGTGGRGPRRTGAVLAVTAVILALPLSAGARSSGHGSVSSATVPSSLLAAAKAHPQQM